MKKQASTVKTAPAKKLTKAEQEAILLEKQMKIKARIRLFTYASVIQTDKLIRIPPKELETELGV
jgi:hypothetical protein